MGLLCFISITTKTAYDSVKICSCVHDSIQSIAVCLHVSFSLTSHAIHQFEKMLFLFRVGKVLLT